MNDEQLKNQDLNKEVSVSVCMEQSGTAATSLAFEELSFNASKDEANLESGGIHDTDGSLLKSIAHCIATKSAMGSYLGWGDLNIGKICLRS